MSYIRDLTTFPYPIGILGCILTQFESLLQDACFRDNVHGHDLAALIQRRVVVPSNRRLIRARKPIQIIDIRSAPKEHHSIIVRYHIRGNADAGTVVLSLFRKSKKAQALERKERQTGEERRRSLTCRGEKYGRKVGRPRKRDIELVPAAG